MPASSCSRSSSNIRDSPSEAASRPGASGERSSRAGIGGAHHVGEPQQRRRREPELLDHHVEGAELAAVAPEHVLDIERGRVEALADARPLRTARRTGSPRSDRRSAGSARGRRCGRSSAAPGSPRPCAPGRRAAAVFSAQHQRKFCGFPALKAAFQRFGGTSDVAAARRRCLARASRRAGRRQWPCGRRTPRPSRPASSWLRLTVPGISRGSAAKSSSVRTSIRTGMFAVPISRASLSGDIVV